MTWRVAVHDIARTLKPLECESSETSAGPTYARLDGATSLALLPAPCGNGAYNYYSYAMLIDNSGKVRPAACSVAASRASRDRSATGTRAPFTPTPARTPTR